MPQIKQSLKEKHKSFKNKYWASVKAAKRIIRNKVLKAKLDFKNKFEKEFSHMNIKQALQKVKTLAGCKPKPSYSVSNPETLSKDLNTYFTRFDMEDFLPECLSFAERPPTPKPWRTGTFHGGREGTESAEQMQVWQGSRAWWRSSQGA